MKKTICLMIALVIFALPTTLASSEEVEIGPYSVSFDLNNTVYEIYTDGPFHEENDNGDPYDGYVVYITLEDGSDWIDVYLEDYDEFGDGVKAFEFYDLWLWNWSPDVIKSETNLSWTKDGYNCTLIQFVDIFGDTSYLTGWTLESPGPIKDIYGDMYIVGSNFVTIRSWANWDITRQLLNTICVVRNEEEVEL